MLISPHVSRSKQTLGASRPAIVSSHRGLDLVILEEIESNNCRVLLSVTFVSELCNKICYSSIITYHHSYNLYDHNFAFEKPHNIYMQQDGMRD